ncbi:MAG TPA: hypothetical protein VKE70_26935 [Candidatus Solibacter sp.]|nr:hypothetical protein [Candidatus Solibacter sp.]
MQYRILAAFVTALLLLSAAPKKITGHARGENQDMTLDVTLFVDPESIKDLLGDDLGAHFVVAQVQIEPKFGKEIAIDRDDFMLRTDKDGDRTKPMAPSQIAGRGGLTITGTQGPGGEGAQPTRGWSMGGPIGMGGAGIGSGSVDTSGVKASVEKTAAQDSPLKRILDGKVLRETKTDKPITGLLYFPMEKQRLKDLEFYYGARENRISLRFRQQ